MQTNGKRRRHWAGGFTLSEILITLVILGFIGALGVPMLGQQKVKKPLEVKAKHGTIECMWIDGQVKAWVSDNEENTAGHFDDTLTDGTACYFTAPTANIYVLQAVGAGGTGADGMYGRPSYSPSTVTQSGSIPTDQGFYAAITNTDVPLWVRQYWNRQWDNKRNYVEYTLKSPLGGTGQAVCEPRIISSPLCNERCEANDPERCFSACRADLQAKSGDSGYGGQVTVSSPIYFEEKESEDGKGEKGQQDKVVYKLTGEETTVSIGDRKATLKASGFGEAAINYGNGRVKDGKNGADANASYLSIIGMTIVKPFTSTGEKQRGGMGCGDIGSHAPVKGLIAKVYPESIHYYSQSLAVSAYFGLAGSPGSLAFRILEKLPSRVQLKLIPAYKSGESYIYMKNKDGGWDEFMKASSGASGDVMNETIPINGAEDLPFPRKYYPGSLLPGTPNLMIATGAGYTSYIVSNKYVPGSSGAGAYPIITRVRGYSARTLSSSKGSTSVPGVSLGSVSIPSTTTCYGGRAPVNGACGSGNNSGNPGAVVVSW